LSHKIRLAILELIRQGVPRDKIKQYAQDPQHSHWDFWDIWKKLKKDFGEEHDDEQNPLDEIIREREEAEHGTP